MTKTEARKAVRWFQKRAGLCGWKIELNIESEAPEWVSDDDSTNAAVRGMINFWSQHRKARIWAAVNRPGDRRFPETGLHTLFHECVHLAMRDAEIESDTRRKEWFVNRMADFVEAAYLAEGKPKRKRA